MAYAIKIQTQREIQDINPFLHSEDSKPSSLKISDPNDIQEAEADRVADRVMLMPEVHHSEPKVSPATEPLMQRKHADVDSTAMMKLKEDEDSDVLQMAPEIQKNGISEDPDENNYTSITQQINPSSTNQPNENIIQRTIELRPPGRGEASAFDRANELVDRMNDLSFGIIYFLEGDGRTLNYRILIPEALSEFDFQMINIIDLNQVIPMRLITSQGLISGHPVVMDDYRMGYVDIDDLMASDDLSFQSILLHFLQERAVTPRYDQRIGTASLDVNTAAGSRAFNRGHTAGRTAEEEHWQDVFGDPDIRFSYEDLNARGTGNVVFRSPSNNYNIFITVRRAAQMPGGPAPRRETGAQTRVRYNNQWYSVEDFLELGVVPGRRSIFDLRLFERRRPQIQLEIPQLEINPEIQFQIRNLNFLQQQIPNVGPVTPVPQVPQVPSSTGTTDSDSQTNPLNPINGNLLRVEEPNIDWLAVNNELAVRGVFMDDRLAGSVISVWRSNYRFFNETLGLSNERSTTFSNALIRRAVGSGLSYDFPTIMEETNRALDSTPIELPVSDIILFIIDQF